MSLFMTLMIAGWITTFAMVGFCALEESGKLRKIRKRMAMWLDNSTAPGRRPEEGLQPERENAF